jgi:hypothetical protein
MAGSRKLKKRILSDEAVVTRVYQKSQESVSWFDSKVSKERERVQQYYNGYLPRRQNMGSASFISNDVYDGVEAVKSMVLEVFSGGDDIAKFDADQDMGVDDCEAATKYAKHIIFQQNNGYQIFNDVIHDGLTCRMGPAKVWWEEYINQEERTFQGLSLEQVNALTAQDEVDQLEAEQNENGTYDGTLVVLIDKSQVRVLQLPPEEFLVAPRLVSFQKEHGHIEYLAHRTLKTKGEMINLGMDKAKVMECHYDDAKGLDLSPEVLARNAPVESLQALDNPVQPEMEKVMVYESYCTLVIDPTKGARLYKVLHSGYVLFSIDEVDEHPFIVYVPLPVPHIVFGNNFAMRIAQTQNARTVLIRAVLDHASMTVNPRWQVVNGGLVNPREMLDNRMGGIVNVRRPDSVSALQVPNLNPFVFEILQLLEQNNEKTTGVSSLTQGLNKDALSKQNSRGLVGDLVSLGTQRQKIAARNFVNNFFVPLMFRVIKLAILNEKKAKIIEVAGKPIRIDVTKWTERTTATVAMHLGYGERDEAVQKHATLYKELSSDPALQNMFTPQNRYALITDTAKIGGITGISRYITPNFQPPQPNPIPMMEAKAKQDTAQAAVMTAQAKATTDQRMAAYEEGKLDFEGKKLMLTAMEKDRDLNRRDLESVARVDVAHRQMALEEKMRPEEAKMTATVAPRP